MKLSPESRKRRWLAEQREVRKMRELVHFLLCGRTCYFCRKPLSPLADAWCAHGNSEGPQFTDEITIHHIDGNHENNAPENKALAHRACHKAHHMNERWAKKERANGSKETTDA